LAVTAGFAAICLAFVSPFARTSLPPLDGLGMAPVLEHPAMLIHPPLLYLGALVGVVGWAIALTHREGWRLVAQRVAALQVALLTVALTLGAMWAYVEQGWGGYWAWDPVENAGLLPWLAALITLHCVRFVSPRLSMVIASVPWILAVAAAVIARSGAAPSVHAFASDADATPALFAMLLATVAATALAVVRAHGDAPLPPTTRWTTVQLTIGGAAVVIVAAGTWWPAIQRRSAMVDGSFFARPLGVLAAVAIGSMVLLGGSRGRGPWLAHIGFTLSVLGFAASTGTTHVEAWLRPGESLSVGQASVQLNEITGTSSSVTARLIVDGTSLSPRIDVYRRGPLAHSALRTRPWRDTLVVMRRSDSSTRVLIEVWDRPFVWPIWIGTLLMTAGAAIHFGRSRFLASRRSTVDPSSGSGSTTGGGGGGGATGGPMDGDFAAADPTLV
jgi:cytochrome c-type biogenesis protein NrfE